MGADILEIDWHYTNFYTHRIQGSDKNQSTKARVMGRRRTMMSIVEAEATSGFFGADQVRNVSNNRKFSGGFRVGGPRPLVEPT